MARNDESGQAQYVEIARILKPVGLNGWCALRAHGRTAGALAIPADIGIGSSEQSVRGFVLEEMRQTPKGLQCRVSGIVDRDGAETLRDKRMYVRKSSLPALSETEYYHFELEDMTAVSNETGDEIGVVKAVLNYPSVDALEIRKADGRRILVPMTKQCVLRVDKQARTITVDESGIEEL